MCLSTLRSFQECLSDQLVQFSDEISISVSSENQEDLEQQAIQLLVGLQFLGASPECENAAVPFLCRYTFPLCDSSGELYLPSPGECETLATETCAREWEEAVSFLGREQLPQCNLLPERGEPVQCNVGTFPKHSIYLQFFQFESIILVSAV